MSDQTQRPAQRLGRTIELLERERTQLQTVGRALTSQEQRRIKAIEQTLPCLRDTRSRLEESALDGEPEPPTPEPQPVASDGRYQGGNQRIFVELRIDEAGSGIISADIYRTDDGNRSYDASIRSNPGERISRGAGSWEIVGSDRDDNRTTGRLYLKPAGSHSSSLIADLRLDSALGSLPVGNSIHFTVDYASSRLRSVGIELEREENIDPLPSYSLEGREVTMESALGKAGFEVSDVGQVSRIPKPDTPWGNTQLHTLMEDFAQASLQRPAWQLHLLMLSRPSRQGLLGVMFDTQQPLPRQGSAVFAGEIERRVSSDHFPRKLLQTTVHELGHALNLVHRFEREVGRADSTSFMNYDWRYKGGDHRNEFWSKFDFSFDDDELEFLRHAPHRAVIPGGKPFHSVNYWADGNGGYKPYLPEQPISILNLDLKPPQGGAVFDFAQPVFLEVTLSNRSGRTLDLSPQWLDPKSGLLEILIRRRGENESRSFIPVVERCYDLSADTADSVPPGQSISNNLNLTFGAAGFPFAEPGEYQVTALLAFPDRQNQRELVVRSNALRIRVAYPKSREEENDAMILQREDVGLYFALGGSQALPAARDALEEVRARRQGKGERITDPIVANIVRDEGIDTGRPYLRYRDGKFSQQDGDRARAAELLENLKGAALKAFDPHTAEQTKKLAQKHRRAAGK